MSEARVEIREVRVLAQGYGRLTETRFELRRRDGRRVVLTRETYERGDAACVLPVDPARGMVLLVRQFRLPTLRDGRDGMMLEAIAGMLDAASPAETVAREAEEEAGVRLRDMRFAFEAFSTPGAVTEKLALFTALYDAGSRIGAGGGLEEEGEDIEVVEMTLDAALAAVASGGIADAKTIMLLQHARLAGLA